MTACVNKHTKRVAAVVTASLVGALSLGVAPVAAMATDSVDMLEASSVWDGIEFKWNVEQTDGEYIVQSGDQFALAGATDPFGSPVSVSDVTVVYFQDSSTGKKGVLGSGELVWNTTPSAPGKYYAIVLNGKYDASKWNNGTSADSDIASDIASMDPKYTPFSVQAMSLEGSFAYQGDNVKDTTFQYTGFDFSDGAGDDDVNFADAKGNPLSTDDVNIVIRGPKGTSTIKEAGTYTATLTPKTNKYSGSATVTFKVRPIDLENDDITIDPIQAGQGALNGIGSGANLIDTATGVNVYVNGDLLADGVLSCRLASAVNQNDDDNTANFADTWWGRLTFSVTAGNPSDDVNFTDPGASTTAKTVFVGKVLAANTDVNYLYDGKKFSTADGLEFETSKGESFDPSKISAYKLVNGKESVKTTVSVYKDGEKVTSYDEPGVYNVRVDIQIPDDLSYAGSASFQVTVISKRFSSQPKAYVSVDGKDVNVAKPEYDGKAVVPVVAVKDGSTTLTEGEDYTVTYKDADGNAVEEIVEPGKYTGTVDFGTAYYWAADGETAIEVDPVTFEFEVTKAQLRSAKADKDVYAYTGDAVTPVFTAYNEGDLEGLSIEIDPAVTGVSYYECELSRWTGEPYKGKDGKYVTKDGALKASELTDEGYYVADVTAPANDAHFEGTIQSEPFQISEYAKFSDVDASAWYADAVYNAADLGYMTGISGTDLFMPMADITRAELAKVFGNMAGKAFSPIYTPTKFGDVDPLAWYAGAVAWADEAGIVTGYDDVTFGPADKATREQVAVMLYRYAKGQGKDVTVEDADATLAAYKDGDQVSDWARTAMAWAVENGVFGQGTDELWAKQNIQRAAVATIAVRFQPEALPEA